MPAFWSHLKKVADPVLQRTAGMSGKICTPQDCIQLCQRHVVASKVSQHHTFELEDKYNELPVLQMQNMHCA